MEPLSVAEAKRRFSELIDRVAAGEEIVVTRRGKPAVSLVAPGVAVPAQRREGPVGLAAIAGALAGEWDDVESDMAHVLAARSDATDRPAPDLG